MKMSLVVDGLRADVAAVGELGDDVGPAYLACIGRHYSSISFAAEPSQLIMARSGLPTCSI